MFGIKRYSSEKALEWNHFVATAKNGTFLFDRRYMDYHSDRFRDYSLMFYLDDQLYALLPANAKDDTLYSHQGLTYGGLVMSEHCRMAEIGELFRQLNDYLLTEGFHTVVYKPIPSFYCSLPSEEDLFALTGVCHAAISSRSVASVVDLTHRLSLSKLRKRGIRKASNQGLIVEESADFPAFWKVLEENLLEKYHATPVHSLAEMGLLHERFPLNIRLFVVKKDDRIVGGTVLYISRDIVKTQYISADAEGKKMGAIDILFDSLLSQFEEERYHYFDFGTSNLPEDNSLNESLIQQKEGFGGRAVCYDTYEWKL